MKQRETALWTSGEHFYTSLAFCSFERLPWMMTCEDWLIFPPFTRSLGYATLISFPYLLGLGVRGGDRRSTTAENADGHQGSCLTVPLGPWGVAGKKKKFNMLPKNCLPVIVTAIRAAGGHPWHVTYPELLKLTPPKIPKRRGFVGGERPLTKCQCTRHWCLAVDEKTSH